MHPRETYNSMKKYEKLAKKFNFVFIEKENTKLINWLINKNVIVGSSSTVLYWAQCLKIPIISVLFEKNIYYKGLLPHIPEDSLEFKVDQKFKDILRKELIQKIYDFC